MESQSKVAAEAPAPAPAPPPCNRCKENEGSLDLRGTEQVCKSCFRSFISSKAVKRLEVFQRETKSSRQPHRLQKYLLALSCGPSSTALVHVLHENLNRQRAKKQRPKFELLVVHIVNDDGAEDSIARPSSDPTPSDVLLERHRARFPDTEFRAVPLSSVLSLSSLDWSALPTAAGGTTGDDDGANDDAAAPLPPAARLAGLFHRLPSASSRADVRRLLTRHLLLSTAARERCDVLLLGHSTTALAEATLAETAKGRGFSLPWVVNDGILPLPRSISDQPAPPAADLEDKNGPSSPSAAVSSDANATTSTTSSVPVYHPMREVFRKELVAYVRDAAEPPLTDLLAKPLPSFSSPSAPGSRAAAVVSHKDLSIDDVMGRYFADVEASYPSVVANVVRTTGKLERAGAPAGDAGRCGVCGIPLDDAGDERWRGEIGERRQLHENNGAETGTAVGKRRLCYGCERSIHG